MALAFSVYVKLFCIPPNSCNFMAWSHELMGHPHYAEALKELTYVTLSTFMNENSLVHVLRLTVYTIYSKTWFIQNARNQVFFNYEETIIQIVY
jgi:hypothetical protein